jgi:tetratricopeptide (TPR) repeat protein
MPLLHTVSALALRPLAASAAQTLGLQFADDSAAAIVGFLAERLGDPSLKLPRALHRSAERAWRGLEIAVAGEGLLSWLDRGDERAFRDQVRRYLGAAPLPAAPAEFRRACARELKAARKAGALAPAELKPDDLARAAAPLARFGDPVGVLQAEWRLMDGLAAEVRAAGWPALADFLALRPGDGEPLLGMGVRYFFRREVEADPALFRGLAFAQLERLDAAQEEGFASLADVLADRADRLDAALDDLREAVAEAHADVLDIKAELARQGRQLHLQLQEVGAAILHALEPHQLDRRLPRLGDTLAVQDEGERRFVRELIGRYRSLPEEERRKLPALLNGVGKLELMSGDPDAARRDFEALAGLVDDRPARAEAQHNRYLAALEEGKWDEALAALRQAMTLDPVRFAPFPPGKFEPERVLGAGGFGVAILCRNRHSGSRVVVKALRTEGLERGVAEVFREAQLLEELDHPAIIRLRDCDYADAEQRRPYLVMDYFDGPTLAQHVRQHGPLAPDDLRALARLLAEGLLAAHERGILHRDIKPANLLVRREGEPGPSGPGGSVRWRARLIDFGLALRPDVLRSTLAATSAGRSAPRLAAQVAGTLDYAAPEQLGRMPGVAVGPRSDVYAFGKTCCFALFQTTQPLRKHWGSVPDDLADLLEQCLAENPADRPAGFAAVLERLRERPVSGGKGKAAAGTGPRLPAPTTDLSEQALRERVTATATALLAPLGLGGEPEWRRAQKFVCVLLYTAWSKGQDLDLARLAALIRTPPALPNVGPAELESFYPAADRAKLAAGLEKLLSSPVLSSPVAAALAVGGAPARTPHIPGSGERLRLEGHEGAVTCLAFSPDGRHLLTGGADRSVRLWDLDRGLELRCLPGHRDHVCSVSFAPDGRRALSSATDKSVRLWDLQAGLQLHSFDRRTNRVVAFAPDGRQAASGSLYDGMVRLWEVDTGREVAAFQGHTDWVVALAFTPDGRWLLSGAMDRTLKVWNLESRRAVRSVTLTGDRSACVAFAADGRRAITGGADRTLRLWHLQDGQELARLTGHTDTILGVAMAADDRFAVSGGLDKSVRVWDLVRGREVTRFDGHTGAVQCVGIGPEGVAIASGSADGTVRVWE